MLDKGTSLSGTGFVDVNVCDIDKRKQIERERERERERETDVSAISWISGDDGETRRAGDNPSRGETRSTFLDLYVHPVEG